MRKIKKKITKISKKTPKRRPLRQSLRRKNPSTKVELINKYVDRKINFEYQILDEQGLKSYRKTGTLKYMPNKAFGWIIYFGKDSPIFYIYDNPIILNNLSIKEQTPYPLFTYLGHLKSDLSQSSLATEFTMEDILSLYKDKTLEIWYLRNGKIIKEKGKVIKNKLGLNALWELHVPKVLGNSYNIFYLNPEFVKLNHQPYLHLEWQKKVG